MSKTHKDVPLKYRQHSWRNHTPEERVSKTFHCEECDATSLWWDGQKNRLQAHSKGEAKVRKHLKREFTRERRRKGLSNREAKGSWKRINFQVWLY